MLSRRKRKRSTLFILSVSLALSKSLTVAAFFVGTKPHHVRRRQEHGSLLRSTPFEADYYDNPYQQDNDSSSSSSSLAVDPSTKLVLGLNKYSHDTALCAADMGTGQVLFALEKERLTRIKHDSGNVATLVETCLNALNLDLEAIQRVVVNNHHHRVLPLEEEEASLALLEWESGLNINGGSETGYTDEENLLNHAEKHELSHHLAHAYSTATQAPFARGLIVVMDGMGETYQTMKQAVDDDESSYTSDFSLSDDFQIVPSDLEEQCKRSRFDWREAESIYTFTKTKNDIDIKPVFKRFIEEKTPPTLYNHGFENMDSLGALYSRASSHIFGDWNACGKVMGLAPWMGHSWTPDDNAAKKRITTVPLHDQIMWGSLHVDDGFHSDISAMTGMPLAVRSDADLFDKDGNMIRKRRYDFDDDDYKPIESPDEDEGSLDSALILEGDQAEAMDEKKKLPTRVALDAIALSSRIQLDLETVAMDFVRHFKEETGETNLCISGGVGLNSVLNGKLCRELGFDRTFISPYPGDEGIAVGCCAFGLYGKHAKDDKQRESPNLWKGPLPPYLGPDPSETEMKRAMDHAAPWLEVEAVRNDERRFEIMAQEIDSGGVIAWYHGRSEVGPRALGHRSILADPRKSGLVRFINQYVKKRESFRPFAPSVLAEEANDWFDLEVADPNCSPYMSLTAHVKDEKQKQIPAVTHVDGSSRLQTVTKKSEPLYHQLISGFFKLTGVPMVLNTSFNTLPGEPIVESPSDAIRSFLCSMGSIEMLVMGDYIIKRKSPDVRALLGETSKKNNDVIREPACPKRAGPVTFESSFSLQAGETDQEDVDTSSRVRIPDRPMHNERDEWFELVDELEGELLALSDGTVSLNDILAHLTATPEDEELSEEKLTDSKVLVQNIVTRLVRLYEHTIISW